MGEKIQIGTRVELVHPIEFEGVLYFQGEVTLTSTDAIPVALEGPYDLLQFFEPRELRAVT